MQKSTATVPQAAGIILWDVDGTLVDSAQLHKDKIIAIAANPLQGSQQGVVVTDADWENELYGKADRLVHAWIMQKNPAYPLDLKTFLEKTEEYFAAHVAELKPRAGALEAFNIFAAKGFYQAAVSSGTRAGIDASLTAIGVKDRLVFTIAEGDTQKSKPDPEPYTVAHARMLAYLAQQGIAAPQKSAELVVEDSKGGAEAGGRSGIATVFWKSSAAKPDSPFATYNMAGADALVALAKELTTAKPEKTQPRLPAPVLQAAPQLF